MALPRFPRRRLLLGAAALPLVAARAKEAARPFEVLQLLDASPIQRELARDLAAGVQAAIAEYNRGAAAVARPVRLQQIEVANDADLQRVLEGLRDDGTAALLGSVGESLSLRCIERSRQLKLGIAHVGPWLADNRHDGDDDVVPLFASREMQIRHALTQLQGMGIQELGVVFGTPADEALLAPGVAPAASRLGLRMRALGRLDSERLNAQLQPASGAPAVLLFLGATLELARLTQLLAQRRLQRYVVSLADIDLASLMQFGAGRSVPLIVTQVVPNPVTSNLGVVRAYRAQWKLLYEEAPTPLSLAGYLTARYFTQVLARHEGAPTRAALLQAFGRRPPAELDGFDLRFEARASRGSRFVTQAMLTADGRLVA
jgi:ABC-type branched-subunit amino acid transport system substrate-binding protein